jgi:chromosome segregation ATPase
MAKIRGKTAYDRKLEKEFRDQKKHQEKLAELHNEINSAARLVQEGQERVEAVKKEIIESTAIQNKVIAENKELGEVLKQHQQFCAKRAEELRTVELHHDAVIENKRNEEKEVIREVEKARTKLVSVNRQLTEQKKLLRIENELKSSIATLQKAFINLQKEYQIILQLSKNTELDLTERKMRIANVEENQQKNWQEIITWSKRTAHNMKRLNKMYAKGKINIVFPEMVIPQREAIMR